MNKSPIALAFFMVGLVAGGFISSHVWVQFARAHDDEAVSQFLEEQLALSNRDEIRGNHFSAAVHALNAADTEAEVGFQWLKRSRTVGYWSWWLRPWREIGTHSLLEKAKETAEFARGKPLAEADHRAAAAVALERSICPALAISQWESAARLDPAWSQESRKEMERRMVPNSSELQVAIDSALIDSATVQDLTRSLSALRSRPSGEGADRESKSRRTSY
jgi:hypothetical protein